jgi:hypothetical protein
MAKVAERGDGKEHVMSLVPVCKSCKQADSRTQASLLAMAFELEENISKSCKEAIEPLLRHYLSFFQCHFYSDSLLLRVHAPLDTPTS